MRTVLAVLVVLVLAPASAASAAAPGVSTTSAARVAPTTASLTGKVDPRGLSTTYHFEWGPTNKYGQTTPETSVGSGTSSVTALADIGGLTPNTVYHYRVVATNRDGTAKGSDHSFRSLKQPLGLSLAATPNPVTFGGSAILAGNLSGTGNAGETIVLTQNPFPFTQGLQPFGNRLVTDKDGNFSVALLSVPITTQYQASVQGKPVASPILTLPVAVKVSTQPSRKHVRRGRNVVFTGSIRPARDGALVLVQKLGQSGRWVTVRRTTTRHRSGTVSVYRRSVRVSRGGRYRVYVFLQDGNYTSGIGREVTIHTT